ncbi:MAG: virulence RhuM family protein [Bacteroidia bacterium]|nr:virulence RhuM family protein [Bacteroidia bacterium]
MAELENPSEFLFYGANKVAVMVRAESVWASQKNLALIFGVDRTVITKHLQNIFECGELDKNSVSAKIAHTAPDGKTYNTMFYNLDAMLSVGYRVNSIQATQFRIWATSVLKEYLLKGFALDDDRVRAAVC